MLTAPPLPKLESRLPLALRRATRRPPLEQTDPKPEQLSPTTTILPSGWMATARATPPGTAVAMPPEPKPLDELAGRRELDGDHVAAALPDRDRAAVGEGGDAVELAARRRAG